MGFGPDRNRGRVHIPGAGNPADFTWLHLGDGSTGGGGGSEKSAKDRQQLPAVAPLKPTTNVGIAATKQTRNLEQATRRHVPSE